MIPQIRCGRLGEPAMKTGCVIGIDGGASSTKAALIDESMEVIAEGFGGPADHFSAPDAVERLEKSLDAAVMPLLTILAKHPELRLDGVGLGLTGVNIPGKRQAASAILSRVLERSGSAPGHTRIAIDSDAVAAWAGALAGHDGAVVIGGTGSVAYGRKGGKEVRKGGFGYLFGDEGSGFRIACDAIRASLQSSEGLGPATSLVEETRRFFGVENVRRVPGKVYAEDIPVEDVAAMCPLVFSEAERGDEVARRIVTEAGRSLASLAVAALKELDEEGGTISYAGGVFSGGELILRAFRDEIAARLPRARVVAPRYRPVVGAGMLAWDLSGLRRGLN